VGYSAAPHAFADVGLRCPLNATASGKIFLSSMPAEEVTRIMAKCGEKFTSSTITSAPRMEEEIAQVRKMRYARNVEELLPGYWVLAAAVAGRNGMPAAAISVTLPLEEFTSVQESAFSTLVKEAARKASLQLGHAGVGRG
jgi:IclR family acetate operon transcriptional repressor